MPSKGQTYDSSGPDIRVRGNAYQVLEKYLQLARDAGTMGDRVAAENFLQHADHYYRVVSAMSEGQRPRIGGREVSVADINVQNANQGLSAAMSGHGHANASSDDGQQDALPGDRNGNTGGSSHGNGNGQNRPQHQQHQNQAPREANGNGQGGEQSGSTEADSGGNSRGGNSHGGNSHGGNSHDEPRRSQHGDDQPDYPEELLPADQQAAPQNGGEGGGQSENRQNNNRMGRGRRRGPGRRVRGEGEEPAPAAPSGEPDGTE
jgi:Domain of unknown function (DUF4167)